MARHLLIFLIISIISKFGGCQDPYDYYHDYYQYDYQSAEPKVTHVTFDFRLLTHEKAYYSIIKPRLVNLALASGRYNPEYFIYRDSNPMYYKYLLGRRRDGGFYGAPYSWMEIHLIFGDQRHERCTLCMATDDLYVLGFRNGTGQFYGVNGKFEGYFPPDAKILPFSESYGELRAGGAKLFWQLPLGNDSAVASAKVVAYTHGDLKHKNAPAAMAAKEALAKLIIMFPEAARFNTVREVFSPGGLWQQVTYLSPRECALLLKWGKLSSLTLKSYRTGGTWGGDLLQVAANEVGGRPLYIRSAQQALQDLDFLIRPQQDMEW